MNKTYKLNNVEVNNDQIKALIKDNPELLEEKKEVRGRYFFPKVDKRYFFINEFGFIDYGIWDNGHLDIMRLSMGIYRTREEAQLAVDKQKAKVACWKWQQENAPFEPDWSNTFQIKYYCYFEGSLKQLMWTNTNISQEQFTIPYFKSQEDCSAFIEANKAHLELLFTK